MASSDRGSATLQEAVRETAEISLVSLCESMPHSELVQVYIVLNFLQQEGFHETAGHLRVEASQRVTVGDAVRLAAGCI